MYELTLKSSYVPAQSDIDQNNISIGELLRKIAMHRPKAEALVEITQDGNQGRCWTYAELLSDAERLANALITRFTPGERVVVWSPNNPQ